MLTQNLFNFLRHQPLCGHRAVVFNRQNHRVVAIYESIVFDSLQNISQDQLGCHSVAMVDDDIGYFAARAFLLTIPAIQLDTATAHQEGSGIGVERGIGSELVS